MEGIVTVLGFVGMAFILAMIILNEVWSIRSDRMRDEIRELSNQVDRLERQQDRLEQQQDRMKGSIEGMREERLTGIKPGGRFRG